LAPKAQVLQFWLLPLHDLETLICWVNIAQQHAANKIPPAHTPQYISTPDPNTNHCILQSHYRRVKKKLHHQHYHEHHHHHDARSSQNQNAKHEHQRAENGQKMILT
jgi:hypothetical protein